MPDNSRSGSKRGQPPPERGRACPGLDPGSAREASRVGVKSESRFNRTLAKTALARKLRRDATHVERRLWYRLRNAQIDGVSFRRQHSAGPYILDFYCSTLLLGIELDGGQHADQARRDRERDEWLGQRGVTVLRFWNSDVVENLSGVLEVIASKVSELKAQKLTPTRRWRADPGSSPGQALPLSGGG
jgi:very-short-patch-repair endonuclease